MSFTLGALFGVETDGDPTSRRLLLEPLFCTKEFLLESGVEGAEECLHVQVPLELLYLLLKLLAFLRKLILI